MNAYKLNGQAGHHYRSMICKHLNIKPTEIYKTLKDIEREGIIVLHDGKKFVSILKEIRDKNQDEKVFEDFFYQASGLFLTKHLTSEEFEDILQKGGNMPVCEDYENWSLERLEERIVEIASELLKAYGEGKELIN